MDSIPMRLDPSNAAQAAAWDGDEGSYWAAHAERFDRSVAVHHRRLLEVAAIERTDHVLDVGCGAGQTTLDAARRAVQGRVLGVDLSSAMLDVARRRAEREGVTNVAFEQADAQVHPFEPRAFDVAISRTGAMFFGDLVAAFRNLGRALRPDGRVVLLTWQSLAANEWIAEFVAAMAAGRDLPTPPENAPGPFALSVPDRVYSVLNAAGYTDISLAGLEAPMWFGNAADDAYGFVSGVVGWMLDGADDATRERATTALRTTLTEHETPEGVFYRSAAWLVTARLAPGSCTD